MSTLSGNDFGILAAYVLPGFVTLWGVSSFSDTVGRWVSASGPAMSTVAGLFCLTLGSVAVGLTLSAVRWMVVDTLHHVTGLRRPVLEFANLDERLDGFHGLIENHYRYYQFYSNMFVAVALVCVASFIAKGGVSGRDWWLVAGLALLEVVLLAGSRDALRKYYSRAERLLGTQDFHETRNEDHDKRLRPRPRRKREEECIAQRAADCREKTRGEERDAAELPAVGLEASRAEVVSKDRQRQRIKAK